ncbi:MAG: hypothetical protein AB7N76_30270 [Planctomycetota bacterium]
MPFEPNPPGNQAVVGLERVLVVGGGRADARVLQFLAGRRRAGAPYAALFAAGARSQGRAPRDLSGPRQVQALVRRERIGLVVIGPERPTLGASLRQVGVCAPAPAGRGAPAELELLRDFLRRQPGRWTLMVRTPDALPFAGAEDAEDAQPTGLPRRRPRERGSERVLLAGFSPAQERELALYLSEHQAVGAIFLTPGKAGTGGPLATRVNVDPGDLGAVVREVRRRRVDLILEGPGSPGLGDLLRRRANYELPGAWPRDGLSEDLEDYRRDRAGRWLLIARPPRALAHPLAPAEPEPEPERPPRRPPREPGLIEVLVTGFLPADERAWAALLSEDPAVARVYLTPGKAGTGGPLAMRAAAAPDDIAALVRFIRQRRIEVVVAGPGSRGLGDRLRRRANYQLPRGDEPEPFLRDLWRRVRAARLEARGELIVSPAPAEAFPLWTPARFTCERDRAYRFRLVPTENT